MIIAVSGGVDSVVLLDMLAKGELSLLSSEALTHAGVSRDSRTIRDSRAHHDDSEGGRESSPASPELIVCHFDHGIRPESDADARFVWELAKKYGLPCEIRREELGEHASEALARERRYNFLHDIAKKYEGKIVTAHHQDDLIETIAINLSRGTGWRGLAVFPNAVGTSVQRELQGEGESLEFTSKGETEGYAPPGICRPLLSYTKKMLYDYALSYRLEWVEDETNVSDHYQRNRLRRQLYKLPDEARQTLLKLWRNQLTVRAQIEEEIGAMSDGELSRYFFTMISEPVALELLRAKTDGRLTRPQLAAALLAIKTFRPGQKFEAGSGIEFRFGPRYFTMKDPSGLL